MRIGSLSLLGDYEEEIERPPNWERVRYLAKPKVIKRNGSFYRAQ